MIVKPLEAPSSDMKDSGASADPTYSILAFFSIKIPEAYRPFVMSKWLRSLRHGNPMIKKIPSVDFHVNYKPYLEKLLGAPDSVTRFAVLSDDSDVILGFSTSRGATLDYIYVHVDARKTGIARSLMPKGIENFTHITQTSWSIWRGNEKYRHLTFNPFA